MAFELRFLDWLQTLHTPVLSEMMKAITHLGDAGALWIGGCAAGISENEKKRSGCCCGAYC